MKIGHSVKVRQNKCGSQPPRQPPVPPVSGYSPLCVVPFHTVPSWSVWPVDYGRSDNMSLPRFHFKGHRSFHLGCPLVLRFPWNTHSSVLRTFSSAHGEAMWWGTETSSQQPWKWAFLKKDPPVPGKALDHATQTLSQGHPACPLLDSWTSEPMR